jgi:hypothetical protein
VTSSTENTVTIERGESYRLAPETIEAIGAAGQIGGQHLERHGAIEPGVGGAIDLTHPAGAE